MVQTLKKYKVYNLVPYNEKVARAMGLVCEMTGGMLCDLMLQMFADKNPLDDQQDIWKKTMANLPTGSSWKFLVHYF